MSAIFQSIRSILSIKWRLICLVTVVIAAMLALAASQISGLRQGQAALQDTVALGEQLNTVRDAQLSYDSFRFWQQFPAVPAKGARQTRATQTEAHLNAAFQRWSEMAPAEAAAALEALKGVSGPARARGDDWLARQQAVADLLSRDVAQRRVAVANSGKNVLDEGRARQWRASTLVIAIALIAALVTALVILSIVRPLEEAVAAIGALADGKLDTPLPEARPDEIGAIARVLHQFRDNAKRLDYLAHYDALTGLPSQASFKESLAADMERVRLNGRCLVVMYVSLDQLEMINEIFGPATGDSCLQLVAKRLVESTPADARVYHVSGAKFALVLSELPNDAELTVRADAVARDILERIAQPWHVHQQDLDVSCTIGIVTCPQDGANYDELAWNAAATLTDAKRKGSNRHQFYTRSLSDKTRARIVLASALRRAVQDEEFTVHYQPIVDVESNSVISGEALIRWQHPTRGLVMPGEFIGVAEESGAINAIGEWCIQQSCVDNRAWRQAGLSSTRLSLNLSTRQLNESGLVAYIERTAERTGVPCSMLELEVTESAMMVNPERSIRVLRHLKALGVTLSVDDFGTGYSSLAYLQRFPLDKIKIDRSFVARLHRPKDVAIVRATTQLAATLGLGVVAEGVETDEQLAILREMGCRLMQGFLFARGLPIREFINWSQKGPAQMMGKPGLHIEPLH
jgi:diguanylate cyclase (GGDEF)-like protein